MNFVFYWYVLLCCRYARWFLRPPPVLPGHVDPWSPSCYDDVQWRYGPSRHGHVLRTNLTHMVAPRSQLSGLTPPISRRVNPDRLVQGWQTCWTGINEQITRDINIFFLLFLKQTIKKTNQLQGLSITICTQSVNWYHVCTWTNVENVYCFAA